MTRASPRLEDQPVNVFEYTGGREITRETTPLAVGAIISAITLICLLIALKTSWRTAPAQ